jgi:hypothetical protein
VLQNRFLAPQSKIAPNVSIAIANRPKETLIFVLPGEPLMVASQYTEFMEFCQLFFHVPLTYLNAAELDTLATPWLASS